MTSCNSAFQTVWRLSFIAALSSCGWVKDATTVTVCSDPQLLELDMSGLTALGATTDLRFPQVSCAVAAECGSAFASCTSASLSCSVSCGRSGTGGDAAGALCPASLTVNFEQHLDYDLRSKIKNQSQANLASQTRLTRLEFLIGENTLNVEVPPIELLVGPPTAQGAHTTAVKLLAKVGTLPANQTGEREVAIDAGGSDELSRLIQDFKQPVRLFARTQLRFQSGDIVPTGRLRGSVKACFRAPLAEML